MTYENIDVEVELGHSRPSSNKDLGRFSERFKQLVGTTSQADVVRKTGISKGTVFNLLNGGQPNLSNALIISETYGVSLDWLIAGEGTMFPASDSLATEFNQWMKRERTTRKLPDGVLMDEFAQAHGLSRDELSKRLDNRSPGAAQDTRVNENAGVYDAGEYATAPLYDIEASCGHGAWNSGENIISRLAFRRDWLKEEGLEAAHLAAIRARGDSMEPTIQSGDTLLVDLRVTTPRSDGIYIIEQDGGLSAKRIQRAPDGTLYIRSDNPAYLDFTVNKDTPLNIIGRLAWFGRRMT